MVQQMALKKYKLKISYKLFCIRLRLKYNIMRVHVAGKLFKLAHTISPELIEEYDKTILALGHSLKW